MAFFHQLLRVGRTDESIIHAQAEHFYDFVQHTSQEIRDEAQKLESSLPARGPNHIVSNINEGVRRFGNEIAITRPGKVVSQVPGHVVAEVERVSAELPNHIPIPFQDGAFPRGIPNTPWFNSGNPPSGVQNAPWWQNVKAKMTGGNNAT